MIDSLPESLMSLRCGLRASEENSQAEFHLSRSIRLAGDHAEAGRTIDIQRRIGRLKVVQHVDELEAQRRAPMPSRMWMSLLIDMSRFQVGKPRRIPSPVLFPSIPKTQRRKFE